ncbi:MAG: multicopper oxidase domain-containing protein [Leptolyngbyaceae cyanobacterium SM2_3_12]|nr:multicopper oxidase domain-containing protein [Leptolyngbyaceae cyanobacterium SM2_3_12]
MCDLPQAKNKLGQHLAPLTALAEWGWDGLRSVGLALGLGSLVGIYVWFGQPGLALAVQAPSQQPAETVAVHLGTPTGALRFEPDHLEFAAGQRYKLVLDNPSDQKHYFTAKDFADSIWSQKVDAGPVEIKGAIHELELKPGAVAGWVFVPQKPGVYELHCAIAGHAEAGMVGRIEITNPA